MSTERKLGEKTGTSRDTLARIRGLAVWAGVWLGTSLTEISADVRKRFVFAMMRYTNPRLLYFYFITFITAHDFWQWVQL